MPPKEKWYPHYLASPEKDQRVHGAIAPESSTSEEGHLFATTGLEPLFKTSFSKDQESFSHRDMALRVKAPQESPLAPLLEKIEALHPSGGERRLVAVRSEQKQKSSWAFPEDIGKVILEHNAMRMVLATSGIFSGGWLPGWLKKEDGSYTGNPPGSSVRLRLVSAVTGRQEALSGWCLKEGKRGPKKVMWAVPAGSVYFFEILNPQDISAEDVAQLWLSAISDSEKERNDGYGLALLGTWTYRNN